MKQALHICNADAPLKLNSETKSLNLQAVLNFKIKIFINKKSRYNERKGLNLGYTVFDLINFFMCFLHVKFTLCVFRFFHILSDSKLR